VGMWLGVGAPPMPPLRRFTTVQAAQSWLDEQTTKSSAIKFEQGKEISARVQRALVLINRCESAAQQTMNEFPIIPRRNYGQGQYIGELRQLANVASSIDADSDPKLITALVRKVINDLDEYHMTVITRLEIMKSWLVSPKVDTKELRAGIGIVRAAYDPLWTMVSQFSQYLQPGFYGDYYERPKLRGPVHPTANKPK
jgi:hypothetical protein